MKRFTCFILAAFLLAGVCAARAEAPASQFGFHGWPYRQSAPCRNPSGQNRDPDQAAPAATQAPISAATPRPTPAPTIRPAATPASSRGDYTTTSAAMQEQKVWNLLNADRAKNGLSALPLDDALSDLARLKARDMKENHYFAHTSPTYGNAASMLKTFGYAFQGVGENIAHHATVEKSEAAFMSSTAHRRNILGSQWKKVGVGVCYDDQGFVYVCQLFVR